MSIQDASISRQALLLFQIFQSRWPVVFQQLRQGTIAQDSAIGLAFCAGARNARDAPLLGMTQRRNDATEQEHASQTHVDELTLDNEPLQGLLVERDIRELGHGRRE